MRPANAIALFGVSIIVAIKSGAAALLPLTLDVDARDVTRGIQHAHLTIPVHPGPLTLAYPKWIPGEHAANGPLTQMVGLKISSARALVWRRDSLDPFSLHVDVPRGADVLDVEFDYLSPPKAFGDGYGKTPNVTPHLLILPFNHFILYPKDASADALVVKANVRIPVGWKFDGALRPERIEGDTLSLPPVSLLRLIDSPLLAGEFFRTIQITEGQGSTRISIAADAPGDLALDDSRIGNIRRLVAEAIALFGVGHYREYVWLVALGNTLDPQEGLEHHESTDIRDAETFFIDPARQLESRTIPHEYVHSWNGKYRRPSGLFTRNYQEPMIDDLLWVYEGMTRYLGDLVLRTRSGLTTLEQSREYLAWIAAVMDNDRPGRAWRSVGDTATGLPGYNNAPSEWAPIRRKLDYYDEMLLVWLDADTLIRETTDDRRSLDDFCREFFGGADRVPSVRPYSRTDLVGALRAIAPLDWDAFLASRVDAINPRAPLDGIQRGGWKLSYDDTPNVYLAAREKVDDADNLSLSLGLLVDVVQGSPAFAAGVAPTMRILAVDGHKWTIDAGRKAIIKAEKVPDPIELIVESADIVQVLRVDEHSGLRNPHLIRNPLKTDLLSQVLAPRASTPP